MDKYKKKMYYCCLWIQLLIVIGNNYKSLDIPSQPSMKLIPRYNFTTDKPIQLSKPLSPSYFNKSKNKIFYKIKSFLTKKTQDFTGFVINHGVIIMVITIVILFIKQQIGSNNMMDVTRLYSQ